ncbi:MAG: hypothetical protein WD691_01710 [Acidimicrobiales bacterium]
MTDEQTAPSEKSPMEAVVEHAVETFVYAPIGLLFEGASLLPQLVEKGKSQVTMARMLGKFAVEQGREEATKAASKIQDQAAGVLDFIGGSVTPMPAPEAGDRPVSYRSSTTPATATRPAKAPGAAQAAARKVAGVGRSDAHQPTPVSPAPPAATPNAAELGIPDYDGLSASHVVNRLAGLTGEELEAVRAYEAANRGRKTILSKVAQLQST